MKKLFFAMLLFAFAVTMFSACSSDDDSSKPGVVTCEVKDVEMNSATFVGRINLPSPIASDFELGFEVSRLKTFSEDDLERFKVENYTSDKTFSYEIDDLRPSTTYFVRSYMINDKRLYVGNVEEFSTKEFIVEAVDLGLSVKWAACNVGATSPEDYGDYFAWGETSPYYTSQEPLTWKDGKSGGYCLQSYCDNDDFTEWSPAPYDAESKVLTSSYDAVSVNWGGSWRMPTTDEMKELYTNCNWTCTTQNGVNGCKVTSKKNGNSIFLPAAGYFKGTTFYSGIDNWEGVYWSSTGYRNADARSLYFYNNSVTSQSRGYRCDGHTIRPVCQ